MSTLSVLTPSFNYGWSIEDAMQSVAQAARYVPKGWEVQHVVVDDGSRDGSKRILERWAPSITLELLDENRGQSHTLNRCLERATGDWIGWLNADDFYLPASLADACRTLQDDVDVLYGDAVVVDKGGHFLRLMPQHPFSLRVLRWWGPYLPVGTVFMRRDLVSKLKWREDLALLLDWDLWLRAAEAGARFRYLQSPLAVLRRHPGQESLQRRPSHDVETVDVRRDHGLPSTPRLWTLFARVVAVEHAVRKSYTGAYTRQMRTAGLVDRTMRWFTEPEGRSSVRSLYERGYGRRVADLPGM